MIFQLCILIGVIGFLQIITGVVGFYVTMRRTEKLTYGVSDIDIFTFDSPDDLF